MESGNNSSPARDRQLPRVQPDLEEFLAEIADGFTGWDFDYLTGSGRMSEAPLPWCYRNLLHPYLKKASSMLDMGTGGGEFLLRLKPLPAQTWATEGYVPNIPVAQTNLKPEGVTVIGVHDDENLPLPDSSLELIINRHESFSPDEVARLLKPGGVFITQQAGGRNDEDFNHWLGAPMPPYYNWSLESAQKGLSEAGLELLWGDEAFVHTRFHDLGAMIFYLSIVEWQIENFSVNTYKPQLSELHRRFAAEGWLDVTCHRFVLAARKPNR
ncbi:class I SAM-dependent methyltransferase [Paenibacillus pasadenensis]|uniref:class I SAM-dependent methyltransferase n=1 Tax=Paenibacillus pasadenensis TaxID=217090 RepID=UPI002040ABD2|nr:class I SAM-dependent methyltransferase [Paenibacillus pasadenensis]MCM3746128.1 class I SAM-dependent methyltransferase [Paenibacillus pasadenensis]